MKIDKKLLQYCLYASGTVLLIYIGITIFNDIGAIFSFLSSFIGKIIGLVKPLLMALVIVYLFKPGVKTIENFLQKRKIFKRAAPRRLVGILAIYLLVIAGIAALISGIYIMIGGKLSNNITISNMTEYLTKYLNNPALSVSSITEKLQNSNISMLGNLNDKITKIVGYVQTYFTTSIGVMTDSVLSIGGNIASFFIALVLSIYLIQDSEYFMDLWEKTFNLIFGKSRVGNKLKEILSIIDITFYKYIRGQLLEACIVGVLSAIVLYFVGIDYALIIGIIAGICNMIPYIGPVVGTILAVIIALLSGQPIRAVWAVVGMIVVQEVDNKLLAPKIVGDSVGLHPVFTMLAIIIGGSVWGLIGMMIAVPVAACFKVLISKWYTYHMEKTDN
ncbi:AI-2E family transporter [Clostridium estertheticum]|uniref:AI-2E family transporter n=1 Tax=Clostridium estertheticum TaxID=238834 RepID=UPI001CF21E61|nr:AI-2E family transporter [Clostridium estertheticum]MCB2305538.1 AI-2E family transporter [Clostridium estertheticum]MCB2343977.1 AI-2E family transporter [Clostridium estertheticum]MCB2348893.1 AI-2E family transporter [Clostridium estertheticum]WAG46211.1 AI-2E family transporter [Clostridium estertheticum]